MKVTFIHHSSFCLELGDKVLVFDYFRGDRIPDFSFGGKMPEFPRNQEIYVFASHKHQDHFDLQILTWQEKYPNIRYIFPKDMKFSDNYLTKNGINPKVKNQIFHMKSNSSLELEGLQIETLPSTDEGVAFLVTYQGKTVYHAGDLHWWHWEGEEEVFLQYQEKTYKRQIDKLAGRHIDLAFAVIDGRLEEAVFWGIDYFMEHVDADFVIPMHLWQDYGLISKCKEREEAAGFRQRILEVNRENQVFEL